jgi:hypothetical protein
MNENILKRFWNELFNDLKERWPDLTFSDLSYIQGNRQKLIEMVRKRRHLSAEAAASDVEDYLQHLRAPHLA